MEQTDRHKPSLYSYSQLFGLRKNNILKQNWNIIYIIYIIHHIKTQFRLVFSPVFQVQLTTEHLIICNWLAVPGF